MKFGEIAGKMFGSNGVIGATKGVFHITKHGVDPAKCGMLCTLGTTAHNMHFVFATYIGNRYP